MFSESSTPRLLPPHRSVERKQIAADPNVPGFLQTLSCRGIITPAANDHWPAREYLAEHRKTWRLYLSK